MPEFVKVARVADIPEGGMLRVARDNRWICLYRVDGVIYATADECSHAVASLANGSLEGYVVRCPKHGAKFDIRTGRHLCFPAVAPIKSYPVELDGDDVLLGV